MGVGGWIQPRPLCSLERDPVPIVQEAGWAPEPVRRGAENLAHTEIRSPNRPALTSRYNDWAVPAKLWYNLQMESWQLECWENFIVRTKRNPLNFWLSGPSLDKVTTKNTDSWITCQRRSAFEMSGDKICHSLQAFFYIHPQISISDKVYGFQNFVIQQTNQ